MPNNTVNYPSDILTHKYWKWNRVLQIHYSFIGQMRTSHDGSSRQQSSTSIYSRCNEQHPFENAVNNTDFILIPFDSLQKTQWSSNSERTYGLIVRWALHTITPRGNDPLRLYMILKIHSRCNKQHPFANAVNNNNNFELIPFDWGHNEFQVAYGVMGSWPDEDFTR